MMGKLADDYLRAVRAVRAAPLGDAADFLLQTETAAVLARELLGNDAPRAPTIGSPGFKLTDAEKALVRAHLADDTVRFRWLGEVMGKRVPEPNIRDAPPGAKWQGALPAVASWAADVIMRRRVEVRALEAEPSEAHLADWLEAFLKALDLALSRAEMTRAPVTPLESLLAVRAGNDISSQRRRVDGVFTTAAFELARWRFVPPKNHPLTLPFNTGLNNANTVLTPGLLRTYLTTFQLAEEAGRGDGTFTVNVPHVINDLWGKSKYREPKRGILRPRPSDERTFKSAFNTLQRIQIERMGDVKLGDAKLGSQPQWLVSCMEFPKGKVYQHAQIVVHAMRNFLQVPNAVLQLEANDTPLALGVAILWRRRIGEVLRGAGYYRAKLSIVADDIGEDAYSKSAKQGPRVYYPTLAARLHRVVREGKLGELHIDGEGPDALVTLTPSEALGTVYSSLAEPRAEPTMDPATFTTKAAELVARRRPGRPRRDV